MVTVLAVMVVAVMMLVMVMVLTVGMVVRTWVKIHISVCGGIGVDTGTVQGSWGKSNHGETAFSFIKKSL